MNKLKKTALQHISCYFMLCINGYINRHINTEGYIHTYDYTETHKGNAVVMVRHLCFSALDHHFGSPHVRRSFSAWSEK